MDNRTMRSNDSAQVKLARTICDPIHLLLVDRFESEVPNIRVRIHVSSILCSDQGSRVETTICPP